MASEDQIREIKDKVDIVDLVGQYTGLKKAGKSYKGLCPFHNEKTPSFHVSPDRNMCWCFGCHQGGDIFKFLQIIENIEFREALEILAERADVKLEKFSQEDKTEKERMRDCVEHARNFFVNELKKDSRAQNYLKEREINSDMQSLFGIGYAPKSKMKLIDHLLNEKFSRDEILNAGLAKVKDMRVGSIEDKFFDRIMIPLHDKLGRIAGFTGRALDDKNIPKYLNSPETKIFKKSDIIFGFHLAKDEAKRQGHFILMEGNLDVITAFQYGIKNAIASSGTAFSLDQARVLSRTSQKIKIAFDADQAGFKATEAVILESARAGIDVEVVNIQDAKDPDEALKKNAELFLKSLNESQGSFSFLLEKFQSKYNQDSAKGRSEVVRRMSDFINAHENEVEKEFYVGKLAAELQVSVESVKAELLKNKIKSFSREKKANPTRSPLPDIEYLLALFLAFPGEIEISNFPNLDSLCQTQLQKKLYKNVEKMYLSKDIVTSENFRASDKQGLEEKISFLAMMAERKYGEISTVGRVKEAKNIYEKISRGCPDSSDFQNTLEKFKKKFLERDG